jgi:hypothetical protein
MKKYILLIVCIICSIGIKAQNKTEYQSIFGEQTTSFNVTMSYIDYGTWTDSIYYVKDTLINDLPYKLFDVVWQYNPDYNLELIASYALRENETRSQIYMRRLKDDFYLGYEGDTIDLLVCDLNLNKGDTFTFKDEYHFPFPYNTVCRVDSVYFDEQQLKHLIFDNNIYPPLEFIEGTGLSSGMFLRGDMDQWLRSGLTGMLEEHLICAYKDEIRTYSNPTVMTGGKCIYAYVGISPVSESEKNLLYPNPVNNFFILNIPDDSDTKGQIEIFNLFGHCVQKQTVTHHQEKINIEHLVAGVYLVRVIDNNGNMHIEKLIVNK